MSVLASLLRPSRERVLRLESLRTPEIVDACEEAAVMSGIRPVHPSMRMLGCALTVKMFPGDNLSCHLALKNAREGDVLIVDAGGQSDRAPWGELMSMNAARKNLAGVVVDGVVRDREALLEGDFPVFCRGFHPRGTRKEAVCELNTPVDCGDVRVRPGQVVVGDANGVVVVSPKHLEAVSKRAAKIRERERDLVGSIRAGEDLFELLGIDRKVKEARE